VETRWFRGLADSATLAGACLLSYWLTTHVLSRVHSVSDPDDLLGGMWAVVATIFVYHDSYATSKSAALSRMAATGFSFALCLIYLAIFPFHVWGLVVLIGLGQLGWGLAGRPKYAATTGITTAVIMVVAAISPHDAWQQPILRLADTVIGVVVGLGAAGCRVLWSGRVGRRG
jgi:uncharacterized membrane protein YccC